MQNIIVFFKKLKESEHKITYGFLGIVLAIFFAFGLHHLGQFITADEHFWLPNSGFDRISNYWKAVKKGEWAKTRINDKPGITLAYTSGIAMFFDDAKGQILNNGTVKRFDPARTQQISFEYRLPILILSGLFIFFFFWIIKKITDDEWIALWSSVFIFLSPILVGISQIVNPDSLFWIFGTASFLSYFAFLQKGRRKFAVMTGIFLGLGLASKYVSVIFFPFFFVMMLSYYLFVYEEKFKDNPELLSKSLVKNILAYLAILGAGMLIFAILMPASFVQPKVLYEGTIGFPGMNKIFWIIIFLNAVLLLDSFVFKSRYSLIVLEKLQFLKNKLPILVYFILVGSVVFIVVNYLARNAFLDLNKIPFDLKQKDSFRELPLLKKYIVEFRALVFALTPVALFGLILAWIKNIFHKSKHDLLVFVLSVFFLVFYAAVLFQGLLVTIRYSIILFPFSAILAAIAIREFFDGKEKSQSKKSLAVLSVVFMAILILWMISYFSQAFPSSVLTIWLGSIAKSKMTAFFSALVGGALLLWIVPKYFPWKIRVVVKKVPLTIFLIAANLISIWLISPFYFSYTNDILPKQYIISGAWGYGGYEAAQYLNGLSDAKNLTVWADAYGVCEFFVGRCTHSHKLDTNKIKINYYFRSLQSSVPFDFPHAMESGSVWRIDIDGRSRSFIKIQKAKPLNSVSNDAASGTDSSYDSVDE
ncbi:MAG TPA: phospholipid carrier-dependent glycosyltransferase [Patescibacteria group bacterium]